MSRIITRHVFRCFKTIERVADSITGAAGPFFVALAIGLISVGAVTFFEVVQPTLPYKWLTTPICVYILFNLVGNYYHVLTVSPGFVSARPRTPGTGFMWAKRRTGARYQDVRDEEVKITEAKTSLCNRCRTMRPERAHHCRICNRCVLKYDHHCPVRINQCVGINNERYFALFLIWMTISTGSFVLLGTPVLWKALSWFNDDPWSHYSPPMAFLFIYILSSVLCFAVSMMASWHLYLIATGVTSIETHDHSQYNRMAAERGDTFVNSYNLGTAQNLKLFFNLGRDGYPWYTLLLPYRVEPYTDGHAWARRPGYDHHQGVKDGEEMTDEEEEPEET